MERMEDSQTLAHYHVPPVGFPRIWCCVWMSSLIVCHVDDNVVWILCPCGLS